MLLPQNNERRIFLSETKDQNTELQYKVTVSDLLFELKVLLKEYYVADFSDNTDSLKMTLNNGQKFRLILIND